VKNDLGRFAVIFGALIVSLALAPSCIAQCGALSRPLQPRLNHWTIEKGPIRLLPAAFQAADEQNGSFGREPSIVGFWHVKFVSKGSAGIMDGTEVDAGYSQWHSEGTEIMNSAGRAPDTGNFCLGVWEQVGKREYKLNHFAAAWDPVANQLTGPGNIREQVTLDRDGDKFNGSFTIDQYDEKLNLLGHVVGLITGTRISVGTSPESIF